MISQTDNTTAVVQAFNQAQQSGDVEKMLALFSDDAQWRVDGAPNIPWVGDHRGKEEIQAFLTTFSENIEVVEAKNTAQIVDGNDMIMLNQMKLKIKKNNEPISSNSVVHFHVENGKITQHNVYENTYDVAVAWRGTPRSQLFSQKGTPFFSDNLEGSAEARLPLPTVEETSGEVRSRLEQLPTVLNVFRGAAIVPSAFPHVMNLASTVLTDFSIDTSLKELAILPVAQLSGAKYEWTQHVPLARKSGLSDDKIAAINRGETNSELFSDREHLILQFVDELVHGVKVSDTTFNKIKNVMSPQHIVELIITTGNYMMQSRLMETLDLPIDAAVDTNWAG